MTDKHLAQQVESKEPRRMVHFTLLDLKNRRILLSNRSSNDTKSYSFLSCEVESKDTTKGHLIDHLIQELGYIPRSGLSDVGDQIYVNGDESILSTMFIVPYDGSDLSINEEEMGWVSLDRVKDLGSKVEDINRYWIRAINWEGLHE